LEARLNQTSRNSSLPPSTEHPHAKPKRKPPRSRRKCGGQPGHAKHERPLLPPEQCTDVQQLKPLNCRRCGEGLAGVDLEPLRHQVWELPVIRPEVTEYRRHRLVCPGCGETTCAPLPAGVPASQSGPRLVAFAGLLMAFFRQSKRRTALFLATLLNQPCCPALTVKMQTQVTAALRPAYEELATALPGQPSLGIDESPTKEAATKSWLWTFVAGAFTVFAWRGTRAATVLTEMLKDDWTGIVNCDRAKMYWMLGRLQWCWAHLKRDFQALADSGDGVVKRLGHDLLRPTRELFHQWSRCRDGTCAATWSRSATRWKGCCCAVATAAIRSWSAGAGNCMTIANGCGRFSIMKMWNRRTTPVSERSGTRSFGGSYPLARRVPEAAALSRRC